MSRLYVETSAVLRALLEGDATLRAKLSDAEGVTSALTFVEATRALSRALRDGRIEPRQAREVERWLASFERSWDVLQLDEPVLRRARGDLPGEPVRTLDAIHLASLRDLDEELGVPAVASCDERVRQNAAAWGFSLVP